MSTVLLFDCDTTDMHFLVCVCETENEEVFEEIRRLRLERRRLLQKIKGLEQQHNSAPTDLEELTQLRECLEQAEAERDRLQTELEELKAGQVIGASDSDDDILDFPVAEKLLSRWSRESPSALDEEEAHSPNSTSPRPADPDTVAELCRQVDELTSQNQELVLKVQMLEMFEKDDPDMQTTGPDFVPTALYDSLRKEFEALQERYCQAQASAEASSMAGEGCEVAGGGEGETAAEEKEGTEGKGTEDESSKELRERLCGKEKQLAHSQSELEELREQVHLEVYSGEQAGGMGGERETPRGSGEVVSLETQQLRERVRELEEALKEREGQGEGERTGGHPGGEQRVRESWGRERESGRVRRRGVAEAPGPCGGAGEGAEGLCSPFGDGRGAGDPGSAV